MQEIFLIIFILFNSKFEITTNSLLDVKETTDSLWL